MRKVLVLFIAVLTLHFAFVTFGSPVFAAPGINKQVGYQGFLKDGSGNVVVDGSYDMVFKIYDGSSTLLWTGNYTAANGNPISVSKGYFHVLLGSGTGNTMTVDFTQDEYSLGIAVGTDPEMSPRHRVGAVPQAFNADTLDSYDSSAFARLMGTPTGSNSNGGSIASGTLSLSYADATNPGLVSATTQTFAGDKTFNNNLFVNGNAGIGTATPGEKLQVTNGNVLVTGTTQTVQAPGYLADFTYDNVNTLQDQFASGIEFNATGTMAYVAMGLAPSGNFGIRQWPLSAPWDISTAGTPTFFNTGTREAGVGRLRNGGTKLYIKAYGLNGDVIYQYTLSTPDDVTTATYDTISFDPSTQDSAISDFTLSSDGTKLFVIGDTNNRVYEYQLSTQYNIGTAVYTGKSFSVAGQTTSPLNFTFNSTGTKLILGNGPVVYQYGLTQSYDVNTL